MTIAEFIEIYRDLDRFIEKGGSIGKLEVFDLDKLPVEVRVLIAVSLGEATLLRLGRYFTAIASNIPVGKTVNGTLTEDDLRRIWRSTEEAGRRAPRRQMQ